MPGFVYGVILTRCIRSNYVSVAKTACADGDDATPAFCADVFDLPPHPSFTVRDQSEAAFMKVILAKKVPRLHADLLAFLTDECGMPLARLPTPRTLRLSVDRRSALGNETFDRTHTNVERAGGAERITQQIEACVRAFLFVARI